MITILNAKLYITEFEIHTDIHNSVSVHYIFNEIVTTYFLALYKKQAKHRIIVHSKDNIHVTMLDNKCEFLKRSNNKS